MRMESYASDAVEEAMQLSQVKSINSFSFRDIQNTLTELWGYCYELITRIESGFYSRTVRLTERLTKIPPYAQNTLLVYRAQKQVGFNRTVFKASGNSNMQQPETYNISGLDLYCPDAERATVWLEYSPEAPFVTFTMRNRDPKLLPYPMSEPDAEGHRHVVPYPSLIFPVTRYGMYDAIVYMDGGTMRWKFTHKMDDSVVVELTDLINMPGFTCVSFILDFPWAFATYQEDATGDWHSVIWRDLLGAATTVDYNPFDYQGKPSRVRFLTAKYNDYTGMGVTVEDQNAPGWTELAEDSDPDACPERFKELGWTPDTLLVYPSRVVYNYLVATLAKRFASINNSTVMAVEEMLVATKAEIAQHLRKNQSAFFKINNVLSPRIMDIL